MELQETVEQSEVVDPELISRLEKEAMKSDRKRSRGIWEIAGNAEYVKEGATNRAVGVENSDSIPEKRTRKK